MTVSGSPPSWIGAQRLTELASLGARSAAAALARFAGRALQPGEPALRVAGPLPDAAAWATGVFFDLEGDLGGEIAILLSDRLREAALARGLGETACGAGAAAAESLLLELGNVVASQTISSIADAERGRILLSVPRLVSRRAGRELAWRARRRRPDARSARIDVPFRDRSGELRALLVLVVDPPQPPGSAHPPL